MKCSVFFGFLGLGCGYLLNGVLADRKSEEEDYRIRVLPIGGPYFLDLNRVKRKKLMGTEVRPCWKAPSFVK